MTNETSNITRRVTLRVIAAMLALICLTPCLNAQDIVSPYSRLGYGLLNNNATATQRQMGGVGYAMNSSRQINAMNPASYASIDSMTFLFDMGINYAAINLRESGESVNRQGGGLDYITIQVPICSFIGASAGLVPYSTVGYSFGTDLSDNASSIRQGNGGLNQAYLGAGISPFKGFSVGANVSYLFGTITHDVMTTPTGSTTALFEQVMQVRDYNLLIGAQYHFRPVEDHLISLGLTYTPSKTLLGHTWVTKYDMVNDVTTSSNNNNIIKADTVVARTSMRNKFTTPESWGAGIGYRWSNKLYIEADFTYQPWANAKFFEIENFATSKFADRWQAGVGVQYTPKQRGSYMERVNYRIGAFYNRDYIMVGDNNVRDFGVSCGFGFPAPMSKTIINLGFEYRHRQAHPNPLLKENHFNVTLSVNFNEMWFFKRRIN